MQHLLPCTQVALLHVLCVVCEWALKGQGPALAWSRLYPQYLPMPGPAQRRGSADFDNWVKERRKEFSSQKACSVMHLAILPYGRTPNQIVRGWQLPTRVGEQAELVLRQKRLRELDGWLPEGCRGWGILPEMQREWRQYLCQAWRTLWSRKWSFSSWSSSPNRQCCSAQGVPGTPEPVLSLTLGFTCLSPTSCLPTRLTVSVNW